MAEQRVIIEMGQGIDLHGQDATKACLRAVDDALHGASLPVLSLPGVAAEDLRIVVTLGVPAPDQVDTAQIRAKLPRGTVEVKAQKGGLLTGRAGDPVLMAMAAIEVFLPKQTGWRRV